MIGFSELRANAWRFAAIALGVLAVALLITCLIFWNSATRANVRADAESARAEALQTELATVRESMARDAVANSFTEGARAAMENSAAETNARFAKLQGILNGRSPVPVDCPSPDPDIMRELAEGSRNFSSSLGRLRGLRSAEGSSPD